MTTELTSYIEKVKANFTSVSEERKLILKQIKEYVELKKESDETCHLILICTHNSRRSHFSQVWSQIAADYYGFDFVKTYSGGTEATAFNPRAVNSLKGIGLDIVADDEYKENPLYTILYGNGKSMNAYSKVFDDKANPQENFAAIMTCDHVDENCPLVPGADVRIPLYYVDPKVSDDTPEETETYAERSFQIATEFFYLFSQIN